MAKKSNLEQDQNEQFSAAEAFVNKNRKYVIGAIVAVVVLGLGWYLYHQYVSVPREQGQHRVGKRPGVFHGRAI